MSSFERYGRHSFISAVFKYSVMARNNPVIPNPACINSMLSADLHTYTIGKLNTVHYVQE